MRVLDSVWFGKIGIVSVQTEYSGVKYYIGTGQGSYQSTDEYLIAIYGYPYYPDSMQNFVDASELRDRLEKAEEK